MGVEHMAKKKATVITPEAKAPEGAAIAIKVVTAKEYNELMTGEATGTYVKDQVLFNGDYIVRKI